MAEFSAKQLRKDLLWGLFFLSAATLTFEINLTRLFSVAQFYHFAFLIVSMALLGFGAGGTFLTIKPISRDTIINHKLTWLAIATGASFTGAYLLVNWLPFDSFQITWNPKHILILCLNYLALSTPFFFSGLATGILLSSLPKDTGKTYAANLFGSAFGCAVALFAPVVFGGEGTVVLSTGMAGLSALAFTLLSRPPNQDKLMLFLRTISVLFVLAITSFLYKQSVDPVSITLFELHTSPYKGLSYALQYPDAEITFQEWNAFSRVDLVHSRGIRSFPGLSYRFQDTPPAQDGLLIDADELSAVLLPGYRTGFFEYLPNAIAYKLRPQARVLLLEPRGGLDILSAVESDARKITAIEANPLIVRAADEIYGMSQVQTIIESDRSYLRRTKEYYDLIIISLGNNYHPVRSGAYSISEDYRYTIESFQDALARLDREGILVVTRWLQNPPSESLRTFSLAVEAIEQRGDNPIQNIVAFRGYNTATFLIKNEAYSQEQLDHIRAWAKVLAYDLIYAPGIQASETNSYNVLPEPVYYQAFHELLFTDPRDTFYTDYPYDVRAPTDDHPFFSHYFKWSQSFQIIAELGKTWQPFGGAGYFVVLALLALALACASVVIVLPVFIDSYRRRRYSQNNKISSQGENYPKFKFLAYFALIGFGFLLVEIPLIQAFILFLGQPAYAMTAVLFTLLFFSGIGSQKSENFRLTNVLGILSLILIMGASMLSMIINTQLGSPFWMRLCLTITLLGPIGMLMGIPFPAGIKWMLSISNHDNLIPWIWAVNGAASVVASVLAALFALSFGFSWVFRIGAFCYGAACLIVMIPIHRREFPRP